MLAGVCCSSVAGLLKGLPHLSEGAVTEVLEVSLSLVLSSQDLIPQSLALCFHQTWQAKGLSSGSRHTGLVQEVRWPSRTPKPGKTGSSGLGYVSGGEEAARWGCLP